MDDVVSKPFRVPELLDRMKALIGTLPPWVLVRILNVLGSS